MTHLFLYTINDFVSDNKGLIITLAIGAISGYIAEFIVPGRGFGFLVTICIGMLGGWLGNMLFKDYLNFTHNALSDQVIRAVAGSMILCIVLNLILGNRQGKKGKEKDVYDWNNE